MGVKMRRMGGPGNFLLGEEEKKALIELIDSGRIFRYGDENDPEFLAKVWNFEKELTEYLKIKHVIAVNSGTSALIVALLALGIGPGDEVIVPGYTFVASLTSIIYAKAIPILAEIDNSLTLDPSDILKKITGRTKAIMLVHMLGGTGYIDEIRKIARDNNLFLIEDCAQAFGVTYKGRSVGSYGDIGTYSFNPMKTITGGEGGAVATDDEKLYKRAYSIHDMGHLALRKGIEMGNRTLIGYDFRMNELSAAVLLVQLKKMDIIKNTLKEKYQKFKKGIEDIDGVDFRHFPDPEGQIHTILTVLLPDEKTARAIGKELDCGVVADSGWHVYNNMEHFLEKKLPTKEGCPFTCPYYKGKTVEYKKGMLPNTDKILNRAINISVGVVDRGLGSGFGISIDSTDKEIDEKIETFRNALKKHL